MRYFAKPISLSVLFALAFAFFACSDDNGTFVPADEATVLSSSSSVEKTETSKISSSSEKSSSSVNQAKSSSSVNQVKLSSSSVVKTIASSSSDNEISETQSLTEKLGVCEDMGQSITREVRGIDGKNYTCYRGIWYEGILEVEGSGWGLPESSSSSESISSSSSVTISSSSTQTIPAETYDCTKYSCVTTEYLNQTLLADEKYGEVLDARDGQVYKTIQIGDQVWMAQNLNLRYTQSTSALDSSSFCYNETLDYCNKFGRLYIWSAAMDSAGVYSSATKGCGYEAFCNKDEKVRGICPEGFHLPNKAEWLTLFENVGGQKDLELKKPAALRSLSMWLEYYESIGYGYTPKIDERDNYGFSALPSGKANSSGVYKDVGELTYFWSSTDRDNPEDGSWEAYAVGMYFYSTDFTTSLSGNGKYGRRSIRCLKD